MNFRYLLSFLPLLLVVSFAEDTAGTTDTITCNTSFKDTLTIQAIDAHSRAIPGADIYVRYQYSGSVGPAGTGNTWYVAGPLRADSSGMATTTVYNIEDNPDKVDCKVTINGSIGSTMNYTEIHANHHPSIISVGVPVYIVNIFVRETTGGTLEGAIVSIGGQSKAADTNGYTQFYLPAGDFPYLVSYLDGKQAGTIPVSDDTTYYALLKPYSISLQVMDDYGNPLNATLTLGNKTTVLGSDGLYSNPKVFGNRFDFTAVYSGATKKVTMYPETSASARVIFDFSAPLLGNFTKSEDNGKVKLTIPVSDPGAYASGVDSASFSVTYKEKSGNDTTGQWNKATTYVVSKGVFAADFPEFPPNSVVDFKVEVSDVEGNKASIKGSFAVLPPPSPPPANNTVTPPPKAQEDQGLPVLYIVGGVVMLGALVYMFFRLRKGGD